MNGKLFGLILAVFAVIFIIIFATANGVSIGTPVPEKQYVLKNATFIGIESSSCYGSSCSSTFTFQDGNNQYLLKGHKHEMNTLVLNSRYDVYYENHSKEIKQYDFAKNTE